MMMSFQDLKWSPVCEGLRTIYPVLETEQWIRIPTKTLCRSLRESFNEISANNETILLGYCVQF